MYFIALAMFLFDNLVALLTYDHSWVRFLKEKVATLNGDINDNIRRIQLIGPGCLQRVLRGVNWMLSLSWLAEKLKQAWHLNLFSMTRVKSYEDWKDDNEKLCAMKYHTVMSGTPPLADLFVLFSFYVTSSNLSVILWWCLAVAGSSMLTFTVLPHWHMS